MTLPDPSRRRFARHAAALAAVPLLPACVLDVPVIDPADYSAAVDEVIASYGLPGVLAAVRVPGDTLWREAFGKANLATGAALSLNSVFPIRSITKSYTVTVLLQLVRDGVLALDHTIDRYIGGVPNGSRITMAHLAGMQSGLVDYSAQKAFQDLFIANPQRVWTEAQLVAYALAVTPPFSPGAQYQYSNTNTVVLGMVIEALTQQTLGDAMAARIFGPLSLTNTAYPSVATLPDPHPTPYSVAVDTLVAEELPLISPTALAGSGALTSSLADLLAWGAELGSGSLIGTTLQALRKSSSRVVTNGPEYARYGLGIGQIGTWWGHTGSGFGFQVAAMHDTGSGATIAVMVNATPDGGRSDLNYAQVVFEALADVVATS